MSVKESISRVAGKYFDETTIQHVNSMGEKFYWKAILGAFIGMLSLLLLGLLGAILPSVSFLLFIMLFAVVGSTVALIIELIVVNGYQVYFIKDDNLFCKVRVKIEKPIDA